MRALLQDLLILTGPLYEEGLEVPIGIVVLDV